MPDRPTCPKCGAVRLIERVVRLPPPRLRDGLSLYLRFRRRPGAAAVRRTYYVCELCGHQWRADEILVGEG